MAWAKPKLRQFGIAFRIFCHLELSNPVRNPPRTYPACKLRVISSTPVSGQCDKRTPLAVAERPDLRQDISPASQGSFNILGA